MSFVQLTVSGKPIGKIEFDIVDEEEGMIEITNIDIEDHKALRQEMILEFTTNRSRYPITGGLTPKRIGNYADGVVNVLMGLQTKYKFDFDPQYLPVPRFAVGNVY